MSAFAARIPLLLTLLRAALAPAMVVLAVLYPAPAAFAVGLTLAFLSDVFDGVLARRWGVATDALRGLDSLADTLFYASALFAAWHLQPDAIRERAVSLGVLAVLEVARYAVDLRKFGREASYHMWSSKLWGVALFAAFVALLVFGAPGPVVTLAIVLGIVADVEGLAISFVLDIWRADVPTLVHAWRLRGRGATAPSRGLPSHSSPRPRALPHLEVDE